MPEYLYKATTLSGQTVEGSMEGKDEEMVIKNLHQLGYIPIRIATAQEKGSESRRFSFLPQRVGVKHLMIFTQELSTLVAAGLSSTVASKSWGT
jgi:type II secretory pathway component PulF